MKLYELGNGDKLTLMGGDSKYLVFVQDVSGTQDDRPTYVATVRPQKRRRVSGAALRSRARKLMSQLQSMEKTDAQS